MYILSFYRKEKGISLLEIIFAIALIGIVMVPLISFFGKTTGYIKNINVKEKAVLLAKEKIEELKAADFTLLEEEAEQYYCIEVDDYPEFERTVEIISVSESALKDVIVTIYWNSRNEKVDLKTRLTKR